MRTHQILHFIGGEKRTLFNVVGVKDNEFCHLMLEDGRKILVNKSNLLMVEIFKDKPRGRKDEFEICESTWGRMFNVYSANNDGKETINSII